MALIIIFSVGNVSTSKSMQLRNDSSPQILATVTVGSRGINYVYATRIISGIGIGGISVVSFAYVSECSPKDVRGRTIGLLAFMSATGAMVSSFVNSRSTLFSMLASDVPSRVQLVFYCTRRIARMFGGCNLDCSLCLLV